MKNDFKLQSLAVFFKPSPFATLSLSSFKDFLMRNTLDYTSTEFDVILQKTSAIILDQYARVDQQPGFHAFSQKEVEVWFDEPLPMQGMNAEILLDLVK
jgi:hypothetical protein